MKQAFGLAFAAVFLLGVAAASAEMPVYDVEAHCKEVAAFGGTSQAVLNGCLRMEQSAYDQLKPTWDSLPAAMRAHCDQVARFGSASYSTLNGCIRMENNAKQQNEQFKFKR